MFKIVENKKKIDEIIKKSKKENKEIIELRHSENKFSISDINEYIHSFKVKSSIAKIGIIYNGDKLSNIQQNKLLKTLEDSKDSECHYMLVDDSSKLLDTIISRAIVLNDKSSYKFKAIDELSLFFEDIISYEKDEEFYYENIDFFKELYYLCNSIKKNNFTNAHIFANKIKFDKEKTKYFIMYILDLLYKEKNITMFLKISKYENKIRYQLNYNLLVDSVIIELKKKEYDDANNWR